MRREVFMKAEVSGREDGVTAEMVHGGEVSTVGAWARWASIGLAGGNYTVWIGGVVALLLIDWLVGGVWLLVGRFWCRCQASW